MRSLHLGRAARRLGWAMALLAGCSWGSKTVAPPPAGRDFLVEPELEAVAKELLRRADEARLPTAGDAPRAVLLPPLTPASRTWDAAALTWALLRHGPALTPQDAPVPSEPALRAWLRQPDHADVVAWMLVLREEGSGRAELVVASGPSVWRSGEIHLPPALGSARPDLAPRASLDLKGHGDALRREGPQLWLESRWGRREVRLRGDTFELGDLQGWSAFDRSWTERPPPAEPAVPVLFAPSGDRRLELRATAEEGGTVLRWWVARAGGAAPVGEPLPVVGRWLSLAAAPLRASTWVVLRETPQGHELAALRIGLRMTPPERSRAGTGPPPVIWVQAESVDPGPWPRDRWSLWIKAHTEVSLVRQRTGSTVPTPEPDVSFHARSGGRVWDVDLPRLPWQPTRPEIGPADWTRALTHRLQQTVPVAYAWLLEPLAARIQATSRGVRLQFERPVPDLVERLAHPVLALDDATLVQRFASHQGEPPRLQPRERGAILEVRPRIPHALESTLRRAPLAALTTSPQEDGESPVDAVLVCSAAAPVELRRQLAWALRGVDASDLLALDETALKPVAPASRRSLDSIWAKAAAPSGPSPKVAFLPIAAHEDADGELSLAQRRLEILLPARGIEVVAASATFEEAVVLVQLARISLFLAEPLLRTMELASWAGAGRGTVATREAATWDPGDTRRGEVAWEAERTLLREGAIVPLWTEPGRTRIDPSLRAVGPWLEGLPPLCWEATVASPLD
jgi:hypothetical protein